MSLHRKIILILLVLILYYTLLYRYAQPEPMIDSPYPIPPTILDACIEDYKDYSDMMCCTIDFKGNVVIGIPDDTGECYLQGEPRPEVSSPYFGDNPYFHNLTFRHLDL